MSFQFLKIIRFYPTYNLMIVEEGKRICLDYLPTWMTDSLTDVIDSTGRKIVDRLEWQLTRRLKQGVVLHFADEPNFIGRSELQWSLHPLADIDLDDKHLLMRKNYREYFKMIQLMES